MTKKTIVFYITPHGYGHATRMSAVMAALRRLRGDQINIVARAAAPSWIFEIECPGVIVFPEHIDIGLVQPNGFETDFPATLKAHLDLTARWHDRVREEAAFLRTIGAHAVIGDVPPLTFDAAAQADVPSIAVTNFGWDWILSHFEKLDLQWRRITQIYRNSYARAGLLLRLPMHERCAAFPLIEDVPLLVRRLSLKRDEARQKLGWPLDRKVVLVSFGGFGGGKLNFSDIDASPDYFIASFEPKPKCFSGQWHELNRRLDCRSVDLIAACDAVISKPGYGIISECWSYRIRLLLLPRREYPENAILLNGLKHHVCTDLMPEEDFHLGQWKKHLDAIFTKDLPLSTAPKDNSDEVIANHILRIAYQ
ncbi:MAG: hypothetical protein HY547_06340 [Elusimicrobia bacterium]|nr:hypothetical protein [Elusimicrobiota bacterium]